MIKQGRYYRQEGNQNHSGCNLQFSSPRSQPFGVTRSMFYKKRLTRNIPRAIFQISKKLRKKQSKKLKLQKEKYNFKTYSLCT